MAAQLCFGWGQTFFASSKGRMELRVTHNNWLPLLGELTRQAWAGKLVGKGWAVYY